MNKTTNTKSGDSDAANKMQANSPVAKVTNLHFIFIIIISLDIFQLQKTSTAHQTMRINFFCAYNHKNAQQTLRKIGNKSYNK